MAWLIHNTITNMARSHLTSGFDYLAQVAGFPISQRPIDYVVGVSSYGRALAVGMLNTLIVAAIGIVLTTILGFTVGIARLSSNWLIARIATVYVETIRNIPLLLQLLFWYTVLRLPMPVPKQSFNIADSIFINQRGFYFPAPHWGDAAVLSAVALIVGVAATAFYVRWANRRQEATGRRPPVLIVALALVVGLPALVFVLSGSPVTLDYPALKGFNIAGGATVGPEFFALVLGLVIYTASFIAEIVRGGIRAVSYGQTEAARALGLPSGKTLRLVVIPQAIRVIIPPLTNQYLNLTKNSSLAHFIGFPDLVLVNETVMNQTNRSIEGIAIVMSIYLIISLVTAAFMNWFNKRVALVER
ncbi:general L-amino acid transport system permease protein [Labrys wisconsinensis]|uniref:General L-amino acid transport system permease protein n=1 Tax=Labrys wisconsinensis TaxID=425677 RepID=A0ABU0J249_9HYPH|nr:amino acid ABC transporter permease [Labrys wisconsinensis]MDQ0468333.1 general L-amino acid transport system permease protein [Labrys wisconsinensis]